MEGASFFSVVFFSVVFFSSFFYSTNRKDKLTFSLSLSLSLFFLFSPSIETNNSRGLVAFEGKYIHSGDACPRCLGSRAIPCPECGGLVGRRPLFSHARVPRASAGVASSVDPGAGLRIGEDGKKSRRTRKRTGELFAALVGKRVSSGAEEENDEEDEEDDNRWWLGFGAQQTLAD